MKTILTALLALALTACGTSGQKIATDANDKRSSEFLNAMLAQAVNDLVVINDCYLRAQAPDTMAWAMCAQQATALRLTSTFLTFMARPSLERVPASRDEMVEGMLKFGIQWGAGVWGVGKIVDVINTGQLAQAQLAQRGIEAAEKPPLIVEPTIIQVPEGSSIVPVPLTPTN